MSNEFTKHDCIWLDFDSWCHATQCFKHALKYEPDIYKFGDEDSGAAIEGHPCRMCEGCGFELNDRTRSRDEQRYQVLPATQDEMEEWQNEKDIARVEMLEKSIKEKQDELKEVKARMAKFEAKKKG